MFSFSLVSMIFFNSSLISWLTHSFFSRMHFNLNVFEFFPNSLLWLGPSFKALWSENMQEWSQSFLTGWELILTWYEIFSLERPMCTQSRCVFCCFRMERSEYIGEVHLVLCVIQNPCFLIDLLRWSVHCSEWAVKVPYYYCTIINVFL